MGMVMMRVYVVTEGMYSDMYIAGTATSLVDAARIVAEKACVDAPSISAFEGGGEVEGKGTLCCMFCNLQSGEISPTVERAIQAVPENVTVPPIVKVFPDANWSPAVFVIGTDRSKVAQAFSDTLAAEAIKRGWAIG